MVREQRRADIGGPGAWLEVTLAKWAGATIAMRSGPRPRGSRRIPRCLALLLLAVCSPGPYQTPPQADAVLAIVGRWAPAGHEYEAYVCSGVRLAPTIAATAAHCVAERPVVDVIVGGGDLCAAPPRSERISVEKVVLHPDFDPDTLAYDLALLRLSRPSTPPAQALPTVQVRTESRGSVVGYGPQQFGGTRPCRPTAQPVAVTDEGCLGSTRSGVFCAAGLDGDGADACPGASGAPLLIDRGGGDLAVAGLASWGVGCGSHSSPGVYVSLSSERAWIREVLDDWTPSGPAHSGSGCGCGLAPESLFTAAAR